MPPLLAFDSAALGAVAVVALVLVLVGPLAAAVVIARRRRRNPWIGFQPDAEPAPHSAGRASIVRPPAPAPVADVPAEAAEEPTLAEEPTPVAASNPLAARPAPGDDPQMERAAAAAERAVDLLRGFRASCRTPLSVELALAMEATVSAWLVDERIGAADVVAQLHPSGPSPHPVTRSVAAALRDLLAADEAPAWELARATAASLGVQVDVELGGAPEAATTTSPGPLTAEVAAALAVGEAEALGAAAGPAGRALLSTWPARSWRLDRVPLVVSPSLSTIAPPAGRVPTDRDLRLTLLAAVEDAARRQLGVEQALADLQRRYLDTWAAEPRDADAGAGNRHVEVVAAMVAHPVLHLDHLAAAVGDSPDVSAITLLLQDASERGWVRELDVPGGPRHWLAVEVVRTAWATLSDPVPAEPTIDLRDGPAALRPTAPVHPGG